jgi:hypothetical protein
VGHKTALRVNAFLVALIVTSGVYAHGGVSVENDTCIMSIGPYRAHFTGYQPAVRASQEFCEDIPVVAKSIIVLDFISQPLRVMAVSARNRISIRQRFFIANRSSSRAAVLMSI